MLYVDDISAEEEAEEQGSWISRQDEFSRRTQGARSQKSKGKSKAYGLKRFSSLKNDDFKAVYRKHRTKADRFFVMYVLENRSEMNRLGISVSKKVGNSVVRHRLTRLIREAVRLHEDEFNSGLDIVVVVQKSANPQKDSDEKPLKCIDVERSILRLAKMHRVLSENRD